MTTQLAAVALGIVCLGGATLVFPQASAVQQSTPAVQQPTRRLPTLRVDAGRVDRVDAVVSVALPPFVTGESLQLRLQTAPASAEAEAEVGAHADAEGGHTAADGAALADGAPAAADNTADDGPTIPLQIDKDRRAWFVLDSLKAGDTRRYTIEPTLDREERAKRVDVVSERDGLTLRVVQQPVLRYQADRSEPPRADIKPILRRGGYLHPVRTPSGRIVTDDYPPAHLHHHGIWAAWAKTSFQGRTPDFWRMDEGTGSVEFESLLDTWSGRVQAGFKSRHRYVDLTAPTPTTVLIETWDVRVYGVGLGSTDARPARPAYRLFDLTLTQELVTPSPLALPEFLYGGVAFHGARSWDGPTGARVLTSEGKTRANGDATRARWCYMGGLVNGATAGIVMLGHPANARAPQPARMYADEPFLNFAPTRAGRLDLAFGRPFVARYRFITLDGAPDVALIERLWRDYADPVSVEVLPGPPTTMP